MTGATGTYGAFKEIWTGVGRLKPDFLEDATAKGSGGGAGGGGGKSPRGELGDFYQESPREEEKNRWSMEVQPGSEAPVTPFAHKISVEPGLFGRLRMRCWSEGELRPSRYSEEVKLPRYLGKIEPSAYGTPPSAYGTPPSHPAL